MSRSASERRAMSVEMLELRVLLDVTFSVDTTQGNHPISPYIYGTNYGQASGFTGYTFSRVGGNRWTAYNWTTNASNAGADWYYSNDNYLGGGSAPGGAVASVIVDVGNHNAPLLLTIPMNGLVSADMNGNVNIDDPNRFTTRFVPEYARKGAPFTLTPPTTGPVYQDEFVNWVKQTYPATQTNPNRPIWYSMDNEPDLWASTHEEVHPAKPTYAELIQKTIEYASAVKDVSAISLVFGPVNYGWNGMMTLQDAPDKSVAGALNFQQYYLQQIANAEATAGRTLVDVDDIHYYSEAYDTNNHRVTDGYTDAAAVAARVQSARSLYDPTYVESSWITQWSTGGAGIDLLHRFQGYIDTYNPGMLLALTEYNFGAGNHISGAIAQADALGAFGQADIFAATYWQLDSNVNYVVSAFNMYRNFDGAGGTFGNTSTSATTTSMAQSGIFASIDSSNPNRIVLVALNRTGSSLTSHFNLAGLGTMALASGNWYALTGSGSAIQNLGAISFASGSGFDLNLPAYSVNTITLTLAPAQWPPEASAGSIPAVTWRDLGKKRYEFTVHYSSSAVLDADSVDGDEITVTGPTGPLTVTLLSTSIAPNGKSIDATYRLTPPGGTWSVEDSGTYTIAAVAGTVADEEGNTNAAANLGPIPVSLPGPGATALVVPGTPNADVLSVTLTATGYSVGINGMSMSYAGSTIRSITVYGYASNDRITLTGEIYICEVSAGAGNDTIQGGSGDDLIRGDEDNDLITGNLGEDTLYGNFGNDSITGDDGADSIMGGLGADTLDGGLLNDSLYGGDQMDWIYGREGDDYIEGRGKADTIYGGAGNDTILGGAGSDLINAEDGDDRIYVGLHLLFADTVDGGNGSDTSDKDANDVLSDVENVLA